MVGQRTLVGNVKHSSRRTRILDVDINKGKRAVGHGLCQIDLCFPGTRLFVQSVTVPRHNHLVDRFAAAV